MNTKPYVMIYQVGDTERARDPGDAVEATKDMLRPHPEIITITEIVPVGIINITDPARTAPLTMIVMAIANQFHDMTNQGKITTKGVKEMIVHLGITVKTGLVLLVI